MRISADDLAFVIDAADFSRERIGESHIEVSEPFVLKQKTTADEISVRIDSHNVARVINIRRERCQAIREIERAERVISINKAVGMAVGKCFRDVIVKVITNDLAHVVNCRRTGNRRAWESDVNRQEQTGIPKKTVEISSGILIVADHLAVVVDPDCFREFCAWKSSKVQRPLLSR